ncbi:MAG: hypothetical protein ACYC64_05155 [Armatimonadota bacterium]
MRIARFVLGFVVMLVAGFHLPVSASETNGEIVTPQQIVVKTTVPDKTLRRYDVVINVKGAQSSDTSLSMKIQHKYLERTSEGLLPVEITLDGGALCSGDQKLAIGSGVYPKLTVLLDSYFRIKDVLGTASLREQAHAPGINYGNMIILFYLPDGDKQHSIGDTWKSKASLPNMSESFEIVSTLKGIETLDGANVALVDQIISREDDPLSKVSVESRFAVDDGRLLKSRASFSVPASSDKTGSQPKVAVVTDIAIAK